MAQYTAVLDPTQPTITHATREDVPEIFAMIKELASYENALDKVEATEQSLARTLTFDSSSIGHTNPGYAQTFILRLPRQPQHADDKPDAVVGMAMYFNNYSTWRSRPGIYLEDLFVRPQYRKRGYGKLLIRELAKEVLRIEGGRLEWSCLRWNESSLEFYRSLGATEMSDWIQLRLDGDALVKVAMGKTQAVKTEVRNGA